MSEDGAIKVTSFNLAKVSNAILVLKNDYRAMEFFVQQVNLPGMSLGETPLPWQGLDFKVPGTTVTWNPLTLTLVCDEEMKAFKDCIKWMDDLKNDRPNSLSDLSKLFQARMLLMSNKNNKKHEIVFENCWLQSIDDLQYMHDSMEDEQMTFTATMLYSYYYFED